MVFVQFFSELRNDGYFVRGESNRKDIDHREVVDADLTCEPVWPSGSSVRLIVLGSLSRQSRFDTPLRLSFLIKGCGLWTLSCDFSIQTLINEPLERTLIAVRIINAESFWCDSSVVLLDTREMYSPMRRNTRTQ